MFVVYQIRVGRSRIKWVDGVAADARQLRSVQGGCCKGPSRLTAAFRGRPDPLELMRRGGMMYAHRDMSLDRNIHGNYCCGLNTKKNGRSHLDWAAGLDNSECTVRSAMS